MNLPVLHWCFHSYMSSYLYYTYAKFEEHEKSSRKYWEKSDPPGSRSVGGCKYIVCLTRLYLTCCEEHSGYFWLILAIIPDGVESKATLHHHGFYQRIVTLRST
eukprot:UN19566